MSGSSSTDASMYTGMALRVPNGEVANRHSGYLVGGTSPFGTRKTMPVYIEASVLELPRIAINGGRRGFLVQIDPQVCVQLLGATPVHCALAE